MSLSRWNLVSATFRYALCGGALYWTSVKGFWGGFCESQNLYCGTTKYAVSQVRQLEWRYGVKILRDEEQIKRELRYNATTFWNIGIHKTFYFLSNLRVILGEQYENIKSGKYLGKEEDDEELEPADYEDEEGEVEEEDDDEAMETKKEEKDKVEQKPATAKNDKNEQAAAAKKDNKVDATGDAKRPDASSRSASATPADSENRKITAALLKDASNPENQKILEEKVRDDPKGTKEKIVEKIRKVHGM